MRIGETIILDTYAEAFDMNYARLIVTAHDEDWLHAAISQFTGYSTSVIDCDVESGCERSFSAEETPDGRPGASVLVFGRSTKAMAKTLPKRTGQCLMTCPTTAVYDGLPTNKPRIPLGQHLRYFGDGFQKSKQFHGRRYWRIPVMDGEFLVEDSVGIGHGVAGGNIIVQATSLEVGLTAASRGSQAVAQLSGVITPFPRGVVRSGSKVGSKYKALIASTADAYCPTLRGRTPSQLQEGVHCVYEIVINGSDHDCVATAMAVAIRAAAGEGILAIGAGNYGGKLGKHHLRLHKLL